MAAIPLASDRGQFHHAVAVYRAAASLRRRGMADDEIEAVEALVEPAFIDVIKARPFSPDDIVAKGEAIVREYGDGGLVPSELVECLLADVRGLVQ